MDEAPYLAGLRLAGRRVVVVGGGTVAQRRIPALLDVGADLLVVAPRITPTLEGLVTAGRVAHRAGPYRSEDLDGAWYVLAVTDDPGVNAAVAADAERARVFCVRADDAHGGTAVTPATGEHGDLRVAVLAGSDPRRSAAVRSGVLTALREGSVTDPGPVRSAEALPGVALVGGGPGDPELITVRGRRLVARADVLLVDRLAPQQLLQLAREDAEVIDVAKLPRGRFTPQETINALMVEHASAGRFVVRLKGGDPFVFGRGREELDACTAAGLPVIVVPGVTSAVGVPGVAGIPVTHRELAQEFTVVSGHVPPGDPRSGVDWGALAALRGTLVLLMAVENLDPIARALLAGGRAPTTPAAVVQEGSMSGQRVVTAPLQDLAATAREAAVRPPAIVVIGDVAGLATGG